MKEKQPARPFRWRAIQWPTPPYSRSHTAWARGAVLVCSSLDEEPAPLHWHLGVTYRLERPSDETVREVLAEFGMEGAIELEVPAEVVAAVGRAPRSRHFRLTVNGNN